MNQTDIMLNLCKNLNFLAYFLLVMSMIIVCDVFIIYFVVTFLFKKKNNVMYETFVKNILAVSLTRKLGLLTTESIT